MDYTTLMELELAMLRDDLREHCEKIAQIQAELGSVPGVNRSQVESLTSAAISTGEVTTKMRLLSNGDW